MTQDEIIEMGKQVGLWPAVTDIFAKELEAFAKLVAAKAIAGLESQEPVAHCEAGPNYCWKCLEESKPTYGSEEIAKLREVNKSLVKNIEELKKEPPPFWPVVQHLLDEYGLQFIDVVAAYREATQPAPVQEPEYVYTCNGCDTLYREDDVACDCTVNGLMEFTRHILAPDTTPPAQPPQRKWVGLTNEELTDLFYNTNLGQQSAVSQAVALLEKKNT